MQRTLIEAYQYLGLKHDHKTLSTKLPLSYAYSRQQQEKEVDEELVDEKLTKERSQEIEQS